MSNILRLLLQSIEQHASATCFLVILLVTLFAASIRETSSSLSRLPLEAVHAGAPAWFVVLHCPQHPLAGLSSIVNDLTLFTF